MRDAAQVAEIARAERERRFAAWCQTISTADPEKRDAMQARADEDHDLWLEIERWALRKAGDPVGRADPWPRTLRLGLASVEKTLAAARQQIEAGKLDEAKGNDLAHLRRWLSAHLPWSLNDMRAEQQRLAA